MREDGGEGEEKGGEGCIWSNFIQKNAASLWPLPLRFTLALSLSFLVNNDPLNTYPPNIPAFRTHIYKIPSPHHKGCEWEPGLLEWEGVEYKDGDWGQLRLLLLLSTVLKHTRMTHGERRSLHSAPGS